MKHVCARFVSGILLTGVFLALFIAGAQAQEQFFTQSGGQGLQNAKTNARLSRMENNVDTLNKEMADIKPHAKAELGACSDDGEKLRYDGNNWICQQETDPTVQAFAKQPLPSCSGGNILGVQGGNLGCVSAGFVTNETDPTVQSFAKQPLPNCGSEQNLTVQNGELKCLDDQVGVTIEKDPYVHDFARTDVTPVLPNCSSSQVLTMVNGALVCKTDDVGISEEVDPFTASFARTDISGYSLAACATGETLTSVANSDGKIILQCQSASDTLAEVLALNDLSDVDTTGETSGTVLMFDGTSWKPLPEQDPNVQTWARTGYTLATCSTGEVLTYDGTKLSCVADAGSDADPLTLAGLADVDVASVADGQFLKYNGTSTKWEPGTVEEFAQTVLPTCTSGQVLTGDGTNLNCTNDAGGAGDPLNLVELGDVRTGPGVNLVPTDKDLLRWDSSSSKWLPVHDKLSGTLTSSKWCYYDGTNVVCDRGAPLSCGTGQMLHWDSGSSAFDCISGTSALGLGSMAYQDADNVAITGGKIDGTVIGGTTPADGHFANLYANGILSTGALFGASLQVSSAVIQGNGVVTGDWTILGNLNVSGSQSIDGVVFANGGVSATGIISATGFSGDGSGLTNVQASSVDWYNVTHIPTPVQEVSNSGAIVMAGISSTNVSVTDNLTVGGALAADSVSTSALTAGTGLFTGDLTVKGNLNVSGSQSIDGVVFANGGVSATGTISATNFVGDGSGLTNIQPGAINMAIDDLTDARSNAASGTVFLGLGSGDANTADNNTGLGINTLKGNTTGDKNTAIGQGAMQLNGDGYENTATGYQALYSSHSGSSNVANGSGALYSNTDGSGNVAIGSQSLYKNTTSGDMVAVGYQALYNNTSGYQNTATGEFALYANTSGYANSAYGNSALGNNTTGNQNAAFGLSALSGGTGNNNTALGWKAGWQTSSGGNNTFVGALAGQNNYTGGSNIAIGYGVTLPTSSTSNSLNIGNSVFGDMTSAAAGVGGAALIGINWVTPTVALEVSGTVSATHLVGDGSGLTGISAAGLGAAGLTGSVQFKGASGEISGTDTLVWDNANANLAVSGSVQITGIGAACSGSGDTGKMRVVDIGSGDFRMEFCRP